MARRRLRFTENGVPLPKPVEEVIEDGKPAVPEVLRVPLGVIESTEEKTNDATSTGAWAEFPLPGEK